MRTESHGFFLLCKWYIENLHRNLSTNTDTSKAKEALSNGLNHDHEHLPLLGHPGLLASARRIVFDATPEEEKTIASIQTIAGTGSNHLGALLMAKACRPKAVWISDPSWINHHEIWNLVDPTIQRQKYPYFSPETFSINFEGMVQTLRTRATAGDVVVLHGCAHNPTGLDLTKEQWQIIADICEQQGLVPFFDLA
jgi:aspartate aminotransferase